MLVALLVLATGTLISNSQYSIMKTLFRNKVFIVLYGVWFILHTFFLLRNIGNDDDKRPFWPFQYGSGLYDYDISEWFVYIIAPLFIIFVIKLLRNSTTQANNE